VRNEFARNEGNGRPGAEMTEWVRSLERPLLNTQAYLEAAMPAPTVLKNPALKNPESAGERTNALPFKD